MPVPLCCSTPHTRHIHLPTRPSTARSRSLLHINRHQYQTTGIPITYRPSPSGGGGNKAVINKTFHAHSGNTRSAHWSSKTPHVHPRISTLITLENSQHNSCDLLYQPGLRRSRTLCNLPCPFWKISRSKVPKTIVAKTRQPRPVAAFRKASDTLDTIAHPGSSPLPASINRIFHSCHAHLNIFVRNFLCIFCHICALLRSTKMHNVRLNGTMFHSCALCITTADLSVLASLRLRDFLFLLLRVLCVAAVSNPVLIPWPPCQHLYQAGEQKRRENCNLSCPFWKNSRLKPCEHP